MGKKRVHELAREYGLDVKDVLQRLQAAGVDAKTHSSSVYEEEAKVVLGRVKSVEAPEVPAVSPRRPGMMIVKKKKDIEQDAANAAISAHVDAEAETEASDERDDDEVSAHTGLALDASMSETAPASSLSTDDEQSESLSSTSVEHATEQNDDLTESSVVEDDTSETQDVPASTSHERPVVGAPVATTSQHEKPHRDSSGPEARRPAHASPGAKPASHHSAETHGNVATGMPRVPARPGAATVVRMIDREKLMERVPSRRLGGNTSSDRRGPPRDSPGQRFGQVTELKVVTDPFGRGREMINVARDRKAKPAVATKVVKKDKAPSKRDLLEMRERVLHPSRLKKKKTIVKGAKKAEYSERKASKRVIRIKGNIVVADLAHQLGVKVSEIITKLMGLGMMITQNQNVDLETAQLIAAEYEYTVESTAFDEVGALDASVVVEEDTDQQPRPPVVTVMGHVDHGKTSLLDSIRKARVAAGEAGGITQHIGAYQVELPGKGSITFLDTPGHAAFTAMRARGAQVTDLVVLVVAADDGVMPQTEEAVKHAQAAKVPIIVAVNKIDRPDAKPERVMQELAAKFELTPEAWGGETLYVSTSATNGTGIPELLDAILLQAEVLELKANANRPAIGVVLEARLDKGRGPVTTVLVQAGTLKRGDALVVGDHAGRVRAMLDDRGRMVTQVGPAAAVEITGLEGVPSSGDTLHVVDSADRAREIAEHRILQKRGQDAGGRAAMTLEEMMTRMKGEGMLELKVVLKADVQGSVEAVRDSLLGLSTAEVKVSVIYAGVGGISESDVTLAAASGGIVIGFNVRPDGSSREFAAREGVEIRSYSIIYEVLDDIRLAMQGLLAPQSKEKLVGHAEVREVFKVSKVGQIAGCRIVDGKAQRSARVRVLRDSVQIHDGAISSLRHFKNDVREVESGQECGVGIADYNDVKVGDMLEFYQIEEIARTLQVPTAPGKRPSGGSGAAAHP